MNMKFTGGPYHGIVEWVPGPPKPQVIRYSTDDDLLTVPEYGSYEHAQFREDEYGLLKVDPQAGSADYNWQGRRA